MGQRVMWDNAEKHLLNARVSTAVDLKNTAAHEIRDH